jgi:hypothetical protein
VFDVLLLNFVRQTSFLPSIFFRIFPSTIFHRPMYFILICFRLFLFSFLLKLFFLFSNHHFPYFLFIYPTCLSATLHFFLSLVILIVNFSSSLVSSYSSCQLFIVLLFYFTHCNFPCCHTCV